jgi:ubiquinone/menaquinone biosynthesis C-methylase UbiE
MSKKQEYEQVHDIYEQISCDFNHTRLYTWKWVDDFINNVPEGSTIFDIGCGNGRHMSNKKHNFIGVDNSQAFVDMCIKLGMNVVKGDMTELPFNDKSADAIITIASFHHLQTKERRIAALTEMKRVLRPGGSILLSVWSKNQPAKTRRHFENYGDVLVPWKHSKKKYERYYYIFKLDEIEQLITDAGFSFTHTWECGNEVYILS